MFFSGGEDGERRLPPRKKLAGVADKTVEVHSNPETVVGTANDIETLVSRVGSLRQVVDDAGETKEGWKVARIIERVERGEYSPGAIPNAFGIRDRYKVLKGLE